MSYPIAKIDLARSELIVDAPKLPNIRQDLETRHFDLPVALHAGYFGLLALWLGVMFAGFRSPGLVIPMAIFMVFLAGFYVVPAMWSRMQPQRPGGPLTLSQLLDRGIQTHVGWCSGRDAAIQVLTIPVLIFGWGLAAVTIAALT